MKRLVYTLFGILFVLYYICYQGALSHILYYHEQHHLFLFSKSYFVQCVQTEGWLNYITNFIIQFFYYPMLGSAILALLLALVYLLINSIIKIVTGKNDVLQLSIIPSLALFFYTMEADHSLSILPGSLLCLLLLYLFLFFIQWYWKLFPLLGLPDISNKKIRVLLTSLFLLGYAGYGFYYFFTNYNKSERIMLKAEQLVKAKDWNGALEYTKKYLDTGRYNQLISYFHHLALYHTGKLSYHYWIIRRSRELKGYIFLGTVTVVKVNTDIFFMNNLDISTKRNVGSLNQWWYGEKQRLISSI